MDAHSVVLEGRRGTGTEHSNLGGVGPESNIGFENPAFEEEALEFSHVVGFEFGEDLGILYIPAVDRIVELFRVRQRLFRTRDCRKGGRLRLPSEA